MPQKGNRYTYKNVVQLLNNGQWRYISMKNHKWGEEMSYLTEIREYDYRELCKDAEVLMAKYPFLIKENIGQSVWGKELFYLRFGEGEKKILLCGAHHGKEWITALLLARFCEILCKGYESERTTNGKDMTQLFHEASYFIIPMLNPDGVELCIHGLSGVEDEKERERLLCCHGSSADFVGQWQANASGVDLNHNYNALFQTGKEVAKREGIIGPGPTRWSGEFPESEPESAALARLTRRLKPDICIAYHSQGEVIYADFEGKASDCARRIAEAMSGFTGYRLDQTEGMASYSGYKDWVIDELGLPAYTVEVGLGENPLPLSQFDEIMRKNIEMLLYLGHRKKA